MSSDSASSEVTYTSISSHGDPLAWAMDFFRLQEPEAALESPNYVCGPEEPEQAPLSPDYVPGPEYPEYLAPLCDFKELCLLEEARVARRAPIKSPMSAAAINQLIETRVAEALTNQEQLRNSGVNGDGFEEDMMVKYCPRGEIKKLEIEIWNLKVKAGVRDSLSRYGRRVIEKYVHICWLCDSAMDNGRMITMQLSYANDQMDQKVLTISERQAEQKGKLEFNAGNNQGYQQLPKRQSVAQAYAVGTGERKEYAGTLPLCNKCKFHHHSPCTVKCANCKKVGHLTRDCWNPTTANHQRTITCYECGNQGHYKSDCPELENQNHGNQAEGTEARGMAYAIGGGETNQDLDNIEDDINA
ncbi:reverse transcriptase domain-containing protein [Tanacetum coccineum]